MATDTTPFAQQRLAAGATLITATKRLARELHQNYHRHQQQTGHAAWATPLIMPYPTWLEHLWQKLRWESTWGSAGDCPLLLNNWQCQAVWEQVITADIARARDPDAPLWNVTASVTSAMAAWRVSREWQIEVAELARAQLADHRRFARWAERYQNLCRERNWFDSLLFVEYLLAHRTAKQKKWVPGELVWLGFDHITPQQAALITLLQKQGTTLQVVAPATAPRAARHEQYHFANEYEHWRAAAQWAQTQLRDPAARVGIVAPDLRHARPTIEYALTQVLAPHHLIDAEAGQPMFHFSLGQPLPEHSVVAIALLLLALLSGQSHSYATFAHCLLSPFLGDGASEQYARSRLEYWARAELPPQMRLEEFATAISEAKIATPRLTQLLHKAQQQAAPKPRATYAYWAKLFTKWLQLFGWPGEALTSHGYQAVQALRRELARLPCLDTVGPPVDIHTVLAGLNARLKHQPFEVQAQASRVEVVGLREAAGLEFTAIWFGGLIANHWPPPVQKNPFIPGALQQAAGYPFATVNTNTVYARRQQQRLSAQCGEIIYAWYTHARAVAVAPSPLLAAESQSGEAPPPLVARLQAQRPQLERYTDAQGLAITEPRQRGGTSLLRDQAACAFRAYARYRLLTEQREPRPPGLDALARGTLVHKIMQAVWREVQTSSALHKQSVCARRRVVAAQVAHYNNHAALPRGRHTKFLALQAEWLQTLILEWLAIEEARPHAFSVVATEQPYSLRLGGITVNFIIDRIDQLADNTLAVIDYKSGRVDSPKNWSGARPEQPQMPLYAMALTDGATATAPPVSALVYAQLRSGECRYIGLGADDFQAGANQVTAANWPAHMREWQQALTALAADFAAGVAVVNPQTTRTCQQCDLHALCRVYDQAAPDTELAVDNAKAERAEAAEIA